MKQFIGQQLIADFYGCDRALLDDLEGLKTFIHAICDHIGTEIVTEAYHKFCPIGVSAFAVITTSHFSIHTWPEYGYAAIDVFSCDGKLTVDLCDEMAKRLNADKVVKQMLSRQVTDLPMREELAG